MKLNFLRKISPVLLLLLHVDEFDLGSSCWSLRQSVELLNRHMLMEIESKTIRREQWQRINALFDNN